MRTLGAQLLSLVKQHSKPKSSWLIQIASLDGAEEVNNRCERPPLAEGWWLLCEQEVEGEHVVMALAFYQSWCLSEPFLLTAATTPVSLHLTVSLR